MEASGDHASTPPKSSMGIPALLSILVICFAIFAASNVSDGSLSEEQQEIRLAALERLPPTAQKSLRTRLKSMLRGAGSINQRNTAILLGGGNPALLDAGAKAIHKVLLGTETSVASLVLDAGSYEDGALLADAVETHLQRHSGTVVITVHRCHVPLPAVVYHLDKFFDEEYGGMTTEGRRAQKIVLLLTGAFGGSDANSVKRAAQTHFKKDAFRAKLALYAPLGQLQ